MKKFLPALFFLVLSTPFWDIGHPLWEVDDARYAEIPREMHESGRWLTPSLNYVDYVEKPPLIYWIGAASYRVFGVSEAAARAPLALVAVLGMLAVWWLGSWLYSPVVGLYAGILLGTCTEYYALSHVITPDMAVSVSLLWATALILRSLREPERGRAWGTLAWIAIAAAILSKGLIGLLFPGIWTVGLLLLFPKLRRGLKPLLFNWGLPVFAVIIGGWFLAMERRNPGFFNFFVVEQHFQRYLTPKYNRPGPWYYFIGVELVGSLPWTPLFLTAALAPLIHWRKTDDRDKQLALWVALIFCFFSVSSSKLVTYILPLFAHQAVLAARLLSRLKQRVSEDRWIRRFAWTLTAVFGAAFALSPMILPRVRTPFPLGGGLTAAGCALLILMGAASAVLACGGREAQGRRIVARTALLGLAVGALLVVGSRYATDHLSVREMALSINESISNQDPGLKVRLLAYNKYLHAIPFYTGRPVDVVNWVGEMHYAKRFKRFAHRFGNDATIRALPIKGEATFVTLRWKDRERFLGLNPEAKPRRLTRYGPWALAEY